MCVKNLHMFKGFVREGIRRYVRLRTGMRIYCVSVDPPYMCVKNLHGLEGFVR